MGRKIEGGRFDGIGESVEGSAHRERIQRQWEVLIGIGEIDLGDEALGLQLGDPSVRAHEQVGHPG